MQNINVNSPSGKQSVIELFYKSMDEVQRNMPGISKRKARKEALFSITYNYSLENKTVKRVLKDAGCW